MSDFQNKIAKYKVKTFKIKGVEILPQAIGEVNFYESILSPAILGDLTIADWQGLDEVGEVFGGDDFEIQFLTEDSEELSLKYKIYATNLKVDPSLSFNAVSYNFCSEWLIDATTRQISKSYKDKYVHEIIKDLLTECGAKIGFIEPSKQKLNHFTTPLWTAIHSITHLCSFAMNKQDVGGYIFWTDLKTDKVNCTTIDYLYKGSHGILEKPFTTIAENQMYENRYSSLNMESNFNIIRYVNQGMTKTRYDGYFYDKNKVYSTKDNIKEITHKHLGTKIPISMKYLDKKYNSIHSCMLHPSTDDLITDDKMYEDIVDGFMKRRYVDLFADCFKINISMNPSSKRRAGNICTLDYQSQDTPKTKVDKQYSGKYVIRDIRHCIFNGNYMHALTLMSDGFKQSSRDLITW